jgi:transposase-like protein
VGTIFEGSHVALTLWLAGFFLMTSSKKSISALQLQRQLGLGSYKSAWHLAHRIRHAMANDGSGGLLAGDVEADETYVGGKPRRHAPPSKRGRGTSKTPVAVLVQRDGKARAQVVTRVDAKTLRGFVRANVDPSATLFTDEWTSYSGLGAEFAGGHHVVKHSQGEYARPGGVHSNTAESYFALLKRGVYGQFHHVTKRHLPKYLNEFSFRWSYKDESDTQRTVRALGQVTGVRLYYKKPKRQGGEGCVLARSPEAGPPA